MRVGRASALALVVLAVALGTAACGNGGEKKQTAAAQARASAHWRAGLVRWNKQMVGALNGISLLFARPGPVELLQAADAPTGDRLAGFDNTLARCSAVVEALGPVPAGFEQAHEIALRACSSLEAGARLVQAGVTALQHGIGPGSLDRATASLSAGQNELSAVTASLRAPAAES
jgi:hypothetical protein